MPAKIKSIAKWIVVIGTGAVSLAWMLFSCASPGLLPRLLGTGGYVSTVVTDVPHPYAFDRPRFWHDSTDELHRSTQKWDSLILGPETGDGLLFASLDLVVRPTAARDAEFPTGAGPYASLDAFVRVYLPPGNKPTKDTTTVVAGRTARDIRYEYVFSRGPEDAPPASLNCRGRSVAFEDRGYYYMLSYSTGDAEYDRYSDVFDRMLTSFHFRD